LTGNPRPATADGPRVGVGRDGAGGFVLTDRSLPISTREAATFRAREPLPFETSVPGVLRGR
jgi:hypothetical protein